jgi:hypothetical protein
MLCAKSLDIVIVTGDYAKSITTSCHKANALRNMIGIKAKSKVAFLGQ